MFSMTSKLFKRSVLLKNWLIEFPFFFFFQVFIKAKFICCILEILFIWPFCDFKGISRRQRMTKMFVEILEIKNHLLPKMISSHHWCLTMKFLLIISKDISQEMKILWEPKPTQRNQTNFQLLRKAKRLVFYYLSKEFPVSNMHNSPNWQKAL